MQIKESGQQEQIQQNDHFEGHPGIMDMPRR